MAEVEAPAPPSREAPAAPNRAEQQAEFVSLCNEEADLKARLAVISEKKKALEPGLLEYMLRMEQQHVRVGGRTLYVRKELWASPQLPDTDDEEVLAEARLKALRALKRLFPGYVKPGYHAGAVSALFREWDANDEPIPKALQKTWKVAERYGLAARK